MSRHFGKAHGLSTGFLMLAGVLAHSSSAAIRAPLLPLINAHSHNDYEHARPLLDALDHGFCSVEADIYLVDGKLLVAHNRNKVQPDRTLETLYLAPLRARIRENGGRVFKNGPQVSLLIDLKTDWHSTYPALRAVLTNYTDILTTWTREKVSTNALLVVVSGSRAREMFAGETWRVAAFDGELRDLESSCSSADIPWISHNWRSSFKWSGRGDMPPDELQRLTSILQQAHMQGRRVRLWGAPDNAVFWQCLYKLGVDLINTDDLAGLRDFLVSTSKAPTRSTPK